jgi:competence protein ComEA
VVFYWQDAEFNLKGVSMKKLNRTFRVSVSRLLLVLSLVFIPFSLFAASPLDINTATAAEFSAVMSGVGVKKAEAIITYRDANGPFDSVEQLTKVKGIGNVLLDRNRDLVRVVSEEVVN